MIKCLRNDIVPRTGLKVKECDWINDWIHFKNKELGFIVWEKEVCVSLVLSEQVYKNIKLIIWRSKDSTTQLKTLYSNVVSTQNTIAIIVNTMDSMLQCSFLFSNECIENCIKYHILYIQRYRQLFYTCTTYS